MMNNLCFTFRFLQPLFHGRGDFEKPEWPPSPLRLLQALVAASAAYWNERTQLFHSVEALKWLEQLSIPIIKTRGGAPSIKPYSLYIPNNTTDLVAPDWIKGKLVKAVKREKKVVRPTNLLSESLHYIYILPDGTCPHFKILQTAVRSITHLGWGIDMIVGNAELLNENQVSQLEGEFWYPLPDQTGTALRVPKAGTLEALMTNHKSSQNKFSGEKFNPVPPLKAFRTAYYRRTTDPVPRPFLAFSILKTYDSGFKAFDTVRRTRDVAAMVRCAVANSARQFGWTEDRINSFIHGHGSAKSGQATTDDRLMFLPLPSITPIKVDSIRRVLMVAPQGCSTKELRNILNGVELIKEGQAEPVAILTLLPKSDRTVEYYTKASSTWSTVTPVLLPGYDDPGHIRKKLKSVNDSDTQKKLLDKLNTRVLQLLQKAFIQAGFSKDLVDQMEFDWRSVGFRSGVDLASKYVRPENLNKFPAYHVFVRFPVNVSGPLAIGAGRYRGFGTFAIHNN